MNEFRDPFLREIHEEFRTIRDGAHRDLGGLSSSQLRWSPGGEAWSIAQCLDHLVTTDGLYLEEIGAAVERGWEKGKLRKKPFKGGWLGRWFAGMVGPDVKMKVKAPKVFRPHNIEHIDEGVLQSFLDTQDRLVEAVKSSDGLDLDRLRIRSPVSRLVRFRLGDGFRIVLEHDKRHLVQARRVLASPGFPAEGLAPGVGSENPEESHG